MLKYPNDYSESISKFLFCSSPNNVSIICFGLLEAHCQVKNKGFLRYFLSQVQRTKENFKNEATANLLAAPLRVLGSNIIAVGISDL